MVGISHRFRAFSVFLKHIFSCPTHLRRPSKRSYLKTRFRNSGLQLLVSITTDGQLLNGGKIGFPFPLLKCNRVRSYKFIFTHREYEENNQRLNVHTDKMKKTIDLVEPWMEKSEETTSRRVGKRADGLNTTSA